MFKKLRRELEKRIVSSTNEAVNRSLGILDRALSDVSKTPDVDRMSNTELIKHLSDKIFEQRLN